MEAIKATFFQECEEQLAELEEGLLHLQQDETDTETVNAVFRAVHSIKGGAGAFGLEDLVRFAHVFETALDDVRAGRLVPDPDNVVKVMLRAADVLADLVRAARDGGTVDHERSVQLATDLRALGGDGGSAATMGQQPLLDDGMDDLTFTPVQVSLDPEPEAPTQLPSWIISFRPRPELYAKANETALLLRELTRLGETVVEVDASALPGLAELEPEGAYLTWNIRLTGPADEVPIREVFEFVEWDCDLKILPVGGPPEPTDLASAFLATPDIAPADSAAAGSAQAEAAPFDVQTLLGKLKSDDSGAAPVAEPPAPPAVDIHSSGPAKAEANAAAAASGGTTIRVDLERVDRLIDLVGELVINQAMLAQRVTEAGIARASAIAVGLDELEQLSREIQDSVMAIRAQPVKSVFQRMPRLAREVAAMTGKQVRLVTDGEATEVDKTVIERLADPLTHMIRNAIDHGLELPEVRLAAGKPAEGAVRLSARHRSGRIVIEIADDGAGINRPRVREIAIKKGLIPADAALSDDETDNLIFLPGFSTATAVSDISGRGVGMDVVKRSVQALGGRIAIASRPGRGSTFSMSLPLTLAVLDGMVVTVAEQTLVTPLTAIIETLQPKAGEVHGLGGDARVIAIRGTYVPLIDIGMTLGYRDTPTDPTRGVALLIEGEGGGRAALLVDAIQGQRQVVIKSLEANYRHVPGIAAATILGDGRVALILDIDSIITVSRAGEPGRAEPKLAMVS
jgi:two-component system chemotaxis sensor kinase CheA